MIRNSLKHRKFWSFGILFLAAWNHMLVIRKNNFSYKVYSYIYFVLSISKIPLPFCTVYLQLLQKVEWSRTVLRSRSGALDRFLYLKGTLWSTNSVTRAYIIAWSFDKKNKGSYLNGDKWLLAEVSSRVLCIGNHYVIGFYIDSLKALPELQRTLKWSSRSCS